MAYIAIMNMNVSGVTEDKHENFLRIGGVLAEVLRLVSSDSTTKFSRYMLSLAM